MKCKRCKADINIFKPPFGAYFCKENHIQCGLCEFTVSKCISCGKETKYKSPYFISEIDSASKVIKQFEEPVIRDVKITEEDEKEFQKLRRTFINENFDEFLCCKNQNDLSSVRTLSALITKNLHPTLKNDRYTDGQFEQDLRFQNIMKALHETDCPYDKQDMDLAEGDLEKRRNCEGNYKDNLQLKLLFPQQSQLRASAIKFTSSNSYTSKIHLKADHKPDDDLTKSSLETSEISSLNFVDLKSISCLNLTDCPPIGFPISIEAVSLDRRPFNCPIDNCIGKIFVSDFNKHIIHDHPTLPLSQIRFGQFKHLCIDVKDCSWIPHSIMGFLMCNVVKNFSNPPLKDILPMLLMMGRYRFKEDSEILAIEKVESDKEPWSYLDCLVIWLIGIVPEQCEISVGISVFYKKKLTLSRWYVSSLNPIESPISVESIFQRGQRLVLSFKEVQMLTNNFKELLHCQIGLVNYTIKQKNTT